MNKILKRLLIIVGIVLVLFLGLVLYLGSFRSRSLTAQIKHMKEVVEQTEEIYLVSENSFYDFDTSGVRFNEIQLLATHNSYKKYGSSIGKTFISIFTNKKEANALKYEYETLTTQLNNGIRSFEFDVRLRKNQFEVTHVPLVDNESTIANLKLGFEEVALFSERNNKHMPIVIILEIKDDFNFLDPFLKNIDDEALSKLNAVTKEAFGDKLYIPSDAIKGNKTLNKSIREDGWDSLDSMLGKVLVVIHAGKYAKNYRELYPRLKDASLFVAGYKDDADVDEIAFIIHNNLDVEEIKKLVAKNLIVRTRIDGDLVTEEGNLEKAINSQAQILSSDFTIGRKNYDGDLVYLNSNKATIIKNSNA